MHLERTLYHVRFATRRAIDYNDAHRQHCLVVDDTNTSSTSRLAPASWEICVFRLRGLDSIVTLLLPILIINVNVWYLNPT